MDLRNAIRDHYWKLPCGARNTICDVPGVRVGHTTVIHDTPAVARTGVTVILPPAHFPEDRLPAAGIIFNGTGELTGLHQINEWGYMETPVGLTGTSCVAPVLSGLLQHLIDTSEAVARRQAPPLPVVGECNDMYLNDSRVISVTPEHVRMAIDAATDDQRQWGAVGGGTGMLSFGFKGGIGSSSRIIDVEGDSYVLGAVTQVNFGPPGDLVVGGHRVGHLEGEVRWRRIPDPTIPDGSLVTIIGTNAPLDHLALRRLAQRGPLGMARVGSFGRHGSGDIFLAFSTQNPWNAQDEAAYQTTTVLRQDALNPLFEACVEATEEAILCALFSAQTTDGRDGRRLEAIPQHLFRDAVLRHLIPG